MRSVFPLLLVLVVGLLLAGPARAQLAAEQETAAPTSAPPPAALPIADAALHYVQARGSTLLYRDADSTRPYVELGFRDPVHVLSPPNPRGWCHTRTDDGAQGYLRCDRVSDVWIRISKSRRMLYVYRGTRLAERVRADFSNNPYADKQQRGSREDPDHWRTPEGAFYVASKNPHSQYYKAFVLNYPTPEDAAQGLERGIITQPEHDAIVRAAEDFRVPPMHTALGGMIEIHGDGTGYGTTWTRGCVAIRNVDLDAIWGWVPVGAPVLIEP